MQKLNKNMIFGAEKRASWLHSAIVPVEHRLEKLLLRVSALCLFLQPPTPFMPKKM